MSANVLVVGGAGYIGSHMVRALHSAGHQVTTFDNLSTGHRDAVHHGEFVHGDLLDREALSQLFAKKRFDCAMHFAAFAYVGESVVSPRKYYVNNLVGTLNLLHAMLDAGLERFIFSSTCATFGTPDRVPITEDEPQRPINPYGRSKLMIEQVLADYARAYGLNSVSLRYFNAAGCDRAGGLSERHEPETHLIPLALRAAAGVKAKKQTEPLLVFGDDYPTPDGTCVRDYIHVEDLCDAHLRALNRTLDSASKGAECFNLGNGRGFSVREVIRVASDVTGVEIPHAVAPRRPGDPPTLIAGASRAERVLGWRPAIPELSDIIASAWATFQ